MVQVVRILVTGGAGYIGSVAVEQLLLQGLEVTVLDNFARGHQQAIARGAQIEQCDLRDAAGLVRILQAVKPEVVMHFAAMAQVPESVVDPLSYYQVNAGGAFNLLQAMREADVSRFVFSSTAAVYGAPVRVPVLETDPTFPINPYGASKLMVEQVLADCSSAYGLRYAAFRYFNVAGASELCGEFHQPETHVIPVALEVAAGEREYFSLFGDDYDTPDGTAIRDYVHVLDLVDAHLLALDCLDDAPGPINLSTTKGFSVRQIIQAAEEVTNREIPIRIMSRRAGDPPVLIADSTKARTLLHWEPKRSTLPEMIGSAWRWKQGHPHGY